MTSRTTRWVPRSLQVLVVLVVVGSIGALESDAARAEDWYLGAAAGSVDVAEDGVEQSGTSFELRGGYRVAEQFALEAGFVDLGDVEVRGVGSGIGSRVLARGFTFAGVGRVPLADALSLHGRAGAFFWDGDSEIPGLSTDPGEIHLFGAVGLEWHLAERTALTVDWTRYEISGLATEVLSAGLTVELGSAR